MVRCKIMKKIIATVLCLTLVISLAACSNAKEPLQTTDASSKTTAESKEAPSTDASAEETNAAPGTASAYIEHKIEKATMPDAEEYGYEDDDHEWCYPEITLNVIFYN